MSELLKCPFCGGEAKYISFTQGLFIQRFVTCTKCGIETPRNCLNRKDAIKRWNNRTTMANIVEKLEERRIEYELSSIKAPDEISTVYRRGVMRGYEYSRDLVKQEFKVGTIEEFKALKEKSEPKKPIYSDFEDNGNDESIPYKAICPVCGYEFNFGSWNEEENHHCRCGQAIDWQ